MIIPTVGRRTLAAALASAATQLEPGDEVLVVCSNDGDLGNAARNSAIERSRGSHLVFLDDDDEYLPGAFAKMRRFADQHPDRVGIFRHRIELSVGRTLEGPHEPTVGGPAGYVVPNLPGKVGRFAPADLSDPRYRPLRPHETSEYLSVRLGDEAFIYSTLRLRGDAPIWVPDVTQIIKPEKNRWRRARYRLRLRTRARRVLRRLSV